VYREHFHSRVFSKVFSGNFTEVVVMQITRKIARREYTARNIPHRGIYRGI